MVEAEKNSTDKSCAGTSKDQSDIIHTMELEEYSSNNISNTRSTIGNREVKIMYFKDSHSKVLMMCIEKRGTQKLVHREI